MQILLKTSDIIKRCLWTEYERFCLKNVSSEKKIQMISNDDSIILNENDAYAIGLLKVIETENLIHRFNIDMEEFLKLNSTINNNIVLVNKSSILKEIIDFKNRFPKEFNADLVYVKAIKELNVYIKELYDNINDLPTTTVDKNEKIFTYIQSSEVKKIIKKLEK